MDSSTFSLLGGNRAGFLYTHSMLSKGDNICRVYWTKPPFLFPPSYYTMVCPLEPQGRKNLFDSLGEFIVLDERISSFLPRGKLWTWTFLFACFALSRVRTYGVYQARPPSLFFPRWLHKAGLIKVPSSIEWGRELGSLFLNTRHCTWGRNLGEGASLSYCLWWVWSYILLECKSLPVSGFLTKEIYL